MLQDGSVLLTKAGPCWEAGERRKVHACKMQMQGEAQQLCFIDAQLASSYHALLKTGSSFPRHTASELPSNNPLQRGLPSALRHQTHDPLRLAAVRRREAPAFCQPAHRRLPPTRRRRNDKPGVRGGCAACVGLPSCQPPSQRAGQAGGQHPAAACTPAEALAGELGMLRAAELCRTLSCWCRHKCSEACHIWLFG